jgi:hypothetical protein
MNPLSEKSLFLTPRVLSIAFIAFLSLFALAVFGEGHGSSLTLLALVIHLIPACVLTVLLILAWRREWIGAVSCAAAGILYVATVLPRPLPAAVKLNWILVIAGPAFGIAGFFLLNWLKRGALRADS